MPENKNAEKVEKKLVFCVEMKFWPDEIKVAKIMKGVHDLEEPEI